MAIGMMDNLHCDFCGEKVEGGWELTEMAPDDWYTICDLCDEAYGVSEGK